MLAYNTSVHGATNFTPYESVRATEIEKLATKNIIKAKLRSKEIYDKRTRPLNAKIEDRIYVFKNAREGKFDSRAHDPYTIVGFTPHNNVTLETESGERFSKHADKLLGTHC